MRGERGRRIFWYALLLSLFIHFVLVPFVHFAQPQAPEAGEKVSSPQPVTIAKRTPPPVVPQPVATPQQSRRHSATQRHARITLTSTTSRRPGSGASRSVSQPPPASPPSPRAAASARPQQSARPGCSRSDAPAAILSAEIPAVPREAREAAITATVRVNVSLSEKGDVTAASIAESSGNAFLDQAAQAAAGKSTYTPAVRRCVPVAGQYVYSVRFIAQ